MMKISALRYALTVTGLLGVLMGQAGWAAAGTLGGIQGLVTDAKTGAPIAGARVQITAPSQSVTATTDAHGHYAALSLPPDDYTLTAEKDGYVVRSITDESVFADQTQVYDLQLDPSSTVNR
jgi:uncharacterized protein YfaS (alpha-2-macroglobulin family)